MKRLSLKNPFYLSLVSLLLTACSTVPSLGGSDANGNVVSGSAAGGNTVDSNSDLDHCDETLGTVAIFEDRELPWWNDYRARYPKLGSTLPVIRLMVQQSNCFVVVERGRTMRAMQRERELMQSGQLRNGSNIGGGQMVAADFTLSPSVLFSEQTGGIGGMLSSFGSIGKMAAGQMKSNEAETNLTLIENRSGVQVASANGSAKNHDFGFLGGLFGGGNAAAVGGFSKTPEGKVVAGAFADSFNQMVKALKDYKAQTVKGGLGKGGRLSIGGDDDKMPEATDAQMPTVKQTVVIAPVATLAPTASVVKVRTYENDVNLEAFDEEAMKDYYRALKNSVEHMGTFAGFTAEQVDAMKNNPKTRGMGTMFFSMIWGGPYVNKLETAQIELESWPVDAKKAAWKTYGSRIEKYNKIFYRHRDTMLKNKAFDTSVLEQLDQIELLTASNLFGN